MTLVQNFADLIDHTVPLLDTPAEDVYDNFTVLASRLIKAPVSLVSIIDQVGNRQFFKSQFGLPAPWNKARETPLSHSFCRLVVASNSRLCVTDARQDSLVKDNPVIDLLGVEAYLGVPILAEDNSAIGSFCVIDNKPRDWTDADIDTLERLGQAVNDQIRLQTQARVLDQLRLDLASKHDQLTNVVKTVPVAVVLLDRNGKIVMTNDECQNIFGVSQTEILRRQLDDDGWKAETIEGQPFPRDQHPFRCVLDEGCAVRDVRYSILWPDQSRRYVSVNASPVADTKYGPAIVCAFKDISDELASTRRLQEAALHAEEVSKSKSIFLANMSHEIRTPLNGVLGMAEVLQGLMTTPEAQGMVATIRQSGETLLNVLNSILDMSKIEAGKVVLESVPICLSQILTEVEALHRLKAEEKAVELKFLISSSSKSSRLGDPHRLTQILNNLISNAIKFTEQGSVTIKLSCKPAKPVLIEVNDTGVGMSDAQAARAFNSFEQADFSTTRHYGGTGLGLSIVQQLVHLTGGTIHLNSELGRGTSVRVTLPLPETDLQPGQAAQQMEPIDLTMFAGSRLLIADDNPINLAVLTGMLSRFDLDLVLAENGQAAVDAWEEAQARGHAYDLLLLDIRMPVLDGLSALTEIRRRESAANRIPVPAIAVTANAMPHQVAEYVIGGFDSHLAKPVRRAELLHTVLSLLRSNKDDASRRIS